MIELQSRPKRKKEILLQAAADTLVLFNLDDGQYYAVDKLGGMLWELCDGTHSVSELVAMVCEQYDTTAETAESDVLEFLGELTNEKLLVEGD
jgi:Coenzyme PQQ synthesis protein D (PqqD).